jgi:hypothetical protein
MTLSRPYVTLFLILCYGALTPQWPSIECDLAFQSRFPFAFKQGLTF